MKRLAIVLAIALICRGPALAASHITIDVRNADLADVLSLIASGTGKNVVAEPSVESEKVTLHLHDVTFDGALAVLTESHNLQVKRDGNVLIVGNGESMNRRYADGSAHVYPVRFLRPSEMVEHLKAALPEGIYIADDAQNAVLVSGSQRVQRVAGAFVRSVDVPAPQVLFEVRVADVEPENDQSNVGIEFGGYDLSGQPTDGAASYAFARNSLAINARLNALISRGNAQILATPKLVTINNKEADLLIGQTYPVTYYDAGIGAQQVQFVDVGVKLRLTPTIGADGSVTAEIHPEYSAIEGFNGGYPIIANRKIDSTLRVKSDETIVLGGLLRDISSETITKVPGLSDIPLLGKLFQNKQRLHQRDEIVFLITPHVMFPNEKSRP